jgi:Zn-dependent M16 (insulinase) family peptidase
MTGTCLAQRVPQPTNGVVFFRSIANVNDLPAHLEPYVPLFCSVLTRLEIIGIAPFMSKQ